MARKNSRTASKKEKKSNHKYHLAFSFPSLVFWSLCLLFLLGWIFVLGILVGRGFLTGGAKSIPELAGKLAGLPSVTNPAPPPEPDPLKLAEKDPEFAFFEKLSTKKEEVARQNGSAPRPKPASKKTEPAEPESQQTTSPYTLQLASVENEQTAAKLVSRLNAEGHPAYLSKATVKGKAYFRVRCGRFNSEKEAVEYLKALSEKEKLRGFVYKLD